MKQRKGMSLVEVMISFVLISFLILMVSGAVTSSYQTSAKIRKLPGLYYEGQQEVEGELDALDQKLTRKYLLEKELGTLADPDPSLIAEIAGLNAEIESTHEKVNLTLFGKPVVLYQFSRTCTSEDGNSITLHAGTASGVRMERPVPVIDQVTINPLGGSVVTDVFSAAGSVITSSVAYSDTNQSYRYAELYQWYVSVNDAHSVYYSDQTPGPDEQQGTLMPVYPEDFTPITSERGASMTVTDEYRGKFLLLVVTPLSVNGKMGDDVMSNPVYVSSLPAGINYRAVLDPSLTSVGYDPSGRVYMPVVGSMSASGGVFTARSGCPYIDLNGSVTSSEGDNASRFLHFEPYDVIGSANGLTPLANDKVFAVVRSYDGAPYFFTDGLNGYGTANFEYVLGPSLGGWMILSFNIGVVPEAEEAADDPPAAEPPAGPGAPPATPVSPAPETVGAEYLIGAGQFDIAEFMIVSDPGEYGTAVLLEYLRTKYGI